MTLEQRVAQTEKTLRTCLYNQSITDGGVSEDEFGLAWGWVWRSQRLQVVTGLERVLYASGMGKV